MHFYRTQTLHGNWKALLRNLAFKRSFSRYGRKMALASASSYTQFSAVCTSGNGKKSTNLVFQGPKLFRNFRLPVSSWKKTCQNIPTVLKYSRKSTPHLPFYHIFPPEFEISQFLGWIKSARLRLADFIQKLWNLKFRGNIFCENQNVP